MLSYVIAVLGLVIAWLPPADEEFFIFHFLFGHFFYLYLFLIGQTKHKSAASNKIPFKAIDVMELGSSKQRHCTGPIALDVFKNNALGSIIPIPLNQFE